MFKKCLFVFALVLLVPVHAFIQRVNSELISARLQKFGEPVYTTGKFAVDLGAIKKERRFFVAKMHLQKEDRYFLFETSKDVVDLIVILRSYVNEESLEWYYLDLEQDEFLSGPPNVFDGYPKLSIVKKPDEASWLYQYEGY